MKSSEKIRKNAMIILLGITMVTTLITLSTESVIADQTGVNKITCYSVLETCMPCRYRAVECSTCNSKKCDDYTSPGKCTTSITTGGGDTN